METKELLLAIQLEIAQIKNALTTVAPTQLVSDKWIPRQAVMKFFNYAPTQMANLENTGDLVVVKIGKRKFILKDSITKLLDRQASALSGSEKKNL